MGNNDRIGDLQFEVMQAVMAGQLRIEATPTAYHRFGSTYWLGDKRVTAVVSGLIERGFLRRSVREHGIRATPTGVELVVHETALRRKAR